MPTTVTQQDCSPRELARVEEFIQNCGLLKRPIPILADKIMLTMFGYPNDSSASQGYQKARAAILALQKQKKVDCAWSAGKRLISVCHKKIEQIQQTATENKPPAIKKPDLSEASHNAAIRRMLAQAMHPKGWAAREADITRRGDRNEEWAHASLLKIIDVLLQEFPAVVLYGRCIRSGKHNPKKGIVNLQDHYGEDFSFKLLTRHSNGQLINGYIIYDSKGNKRHVKEFNQNIYYKPGQGGALMKRAIWANARSTSRKNFAREVLEDCINVGLLPKNFDTEKALGFFED